MNVAGRTYALATLEGGPSPFLITDYTAPDSTRSIHWIVSEVVDFHADSTFSLLTTHRWSEESPGQPADVYEDMGSGSGWFRQRGDRVAVAWNWISVPPDSGYADTLVVRGDSLARRLTLPAPCPVCPRGPEVELVYAPNVALRAQR